MVDEKYDNEIYQNFRIFFEMLKEFFEMIKKFFKKISKFLKRIFKVLKKSLTPKKTDKKEIKKLLSKEEFLRFKIIQEEISLLKAKTDLAKFLKKRKK